MTTSEEESDRHRQLVQKFCLGSEDAFRQLFLEEQFRVRGYLKRKFGNLEDPEGVCQEAWLKAWEGKAGLLDINKNGFRPWMFSIASSCAIDAIRKAQALKRTRNDDVNRKPENTTRENAVLTADLEDCARELKRQYPTFYAALMRSIFGESDLLTEFIAENAELNQTPADGSTPYTQKHRAISKLRDCLRVKGWRT